MWQKVEVHFNYLFKLERESVGNDNTSHERIGIWMFYLFIFIIPTLVFLWLSILQMYVGNGKFYYQSLSFDINLFDLYHQMCSLRDMFTYVVPLRRHVWHGKRPVHQYRSMSLLHEPVYALLHPVYRHPFMARNKLFLNSKYLYTFVGLLPFLFSVF
jgi:hypothetical protein